MTTSGDVKSASSQTIIMEVLKGDGETMRSLCGMLVNGGVRSGCRKW